MMRGDARLKFTAFEVEMILARKQRQHASEIKQWRNVVRFVVVNNLDSR